MRKKLTNRVAYDDVINFDIKDVFNIYKEYSNQELPNIYKKFSFGRALIEKAEGSLLTDYNGKKVFDFGRSTPEEGTYRFKKQWGAEPEQLCWHNLIETAIQQESSESEIRDKLELIWQKMPMSGANFIGPIIRKYISL